MDTSAVKTGRRPSVDSAVAFAVMFCVIPFAIWTVSNHVSGFLGISWGTLSLGFLIALPVVLILSYFAATAFADWLCPSLVDTERPTGVESPKVMAVLVVAGIAIILIEDYALRYGIAIVGLAAVWLTSRVKIEEPAARRDTLSSLSDRWAAVLLAVFALVAVCVVLFVHRPNRDDTSFLQIPIQTLLHPDRPAMSFDMALGPITEPFRFAAYRIASYETAVAFVSEWTGLSLLPVYYLLVPAFTAVVSIGVTFLFARWFLPRGLAVAATAVFLLIMLAWGDSSITYGTRVFVRLFQGKGLIIALTVPLTIVTGLLLLRSPSIGKVVILSMVQVTTLGVSSSGLPIVFVTTAIVGVAALQPSIGRVLQLWLTLGATLIYPALALAWLTLGNESNVALSEIGSRRPINTALGFGLREALALITLLIGMAAVGERQTTREYRALVAGTLAFALNPWLAEFAASIASRNMSWRLAWASPVPLLMSVALVAAAGGLMWRTTSRRWIGPAAAACAAVILIVFIAAGRWTIAPGGRVAWKVHTAKLDAEYYAVERAMRKIEKLELDGSILAPSAIAAWIPVTAPGKHLVMPGRSYPSMYQTVMAPEEFAERRQLYRAINADQPDLEKQAVLLRKYDVGTIIIPRGIEAADLLPGAELDGLLMRTHPWKGPFDIVEIDWKEPEDR